MPHEPPKPTSPGLLQHVVAELVRRGGPALSAHQLGVFLICYLRDEPMTLREVAEEMGVSRIVVTRAVEQLNERGLARQTPDPEDEKLMLIRRTPGGDTLLDDIRVITQSHHASAEHMI